MERGPLTHLKCCSSLDALGRERSTREKSCQICSRAVREYGVTASEPHDWDDSYAGPPPPWDIGRPQPACVRLAEVRRVPWRCARRRMRHRRAHHPCRAPWRHPHPWHRRSRAPSRPPGARPPSETSTLVSRCVTRSSSTKLDETFDTIVDSGLFHVFDDAARDRYVAALHSALRLEGHLHLICFSDREPGDWGPRRVTEAELRAAFGSDWRIASLAPDRFDINAGLDTSTAEAWIADVVRHTNQECAPNRTRCRRTIYAISSGNDTNSLKLKDGRFSRRSQFVLELDRLFAIRALVRHRRSPPSRRSPDRRVARSRGRALH